MKTSVHFSASVEYGLNYIEYKKKREPYVLNAAVKSDPNLSRGASDSNAEVICQSDFLAKETAFLKSRGMELRAKPLTGSAMSAHKKPLKYAFILIAAPIEGKGLKLKEDIESRRKQYENFCQSLPQLKDASREDVYKKRVIVKKYDDMMQHVKVFMTKAASNALIADVIFNGHGSERGMQFQDEETHVPLDKFLSDMQALKKKSIAFPSRLNIVFGQCFGHLFEAPDRDDIKVYCFTSEKKEKTITRIMRDDFKVIKDAIHHPLNNYFLRKRRFNCMDAVEEEGFQTEHEAKRRKTKLV